MPTVYKIKSLCPPMENHALGSWRIACKSTMTLTDSGRAVFFSEIECKGKLYGFSGDLISLPYDPHRDTVTDVVANFCRTGLVDILRRERPQLAYLCISTLTHGIHNGQHYLQFYLGTPRAVTKDVFEYNDINTLMTTDDVVAQLENEELF